MPATPRPANANNGYLLPEVVDPETSISVCVPIPNDTNHIRAFLGQLDMLGYWWTWQRDSAKTGRQAAHVWRRVVDIVRARIDSEENCEMVQNCCVETVVVLHRVNPETGRLEISTDDGATWQQDPQDPGVTSVQLPPPVTSGAATDKCNAAANARNSVEDWVAEINSKKTEGVSFVDFITAVALAVVSVFVAIGTLGTTIALIIPIVLATAKLVYEMSNSEFADYWTTDVYDKIVCAFFCSMNADGSLDEAGYHKLLLKISLYLPSGGQKQALLAMLKARGQVGCNNMGTTGTGTADCSDCECEACGYDWEIGSRFNAGGSPVGTLVSKGLDPETNRYYWIIASEDDGTGDQAIFLTSGQTDNCCNIPFSDIQVIEGEGYETSSFVRCDHALTDFEFGAIGTICCNSVGFANEGANPMTLKIFLAEGSEEFPCPPEL